MQDCSAAPLPAGFPGFIRDLFKVGISNHIGHVWATRTRFCYWFMGWLLRSHNDGTVKTTETDTAHPISLCSWAQHSRTTWGHSYLKSLPWPEGQKHLPCWCNRHPAHLWPLFFPSKYSGEALKILRKHNLPWGPLQEHAVGSEGSCWVLYFVTCNTQCKQARV